MEMIFAFGAGMLTLINPCVLPVLPIVLASALNASRVGPVALAGGMAVSFVVLGMLVYGAGQAIGLDERVVGRTGAVLMVTFGLVLAVPQMSARFATATAGFSARADAAIGRMDQGGWQGQALGGLLLGAVWSPCVGPTLGGAIAMASQGETLLLAAAIMTAFALGVGVVVVGLGYGARGLLQRNRGAMMRFAHVARPVLGIAFALVGLAILFDLHIAADTWLLDRMPIWLQDLSVAL
ncbi:MAG: cytochrome c biogenesis protein CcdA [Pseudomonadota bacterium]